MDKKVKVTCVFLESELAEFANEIHLLHGEVTRSNLIRLKCGKPAFKWGLEKGRTNNPRGPRRKHPKPAADETSNQS